MPLMCLRRGIRAPQGRPAFIFCPLFFLGCYRPMTSTVLPETPVKLKSVQFYSPFPPKKKGEKHFLKVEIMRKVDAKAIVGGEKAIREQMGNKGFWKGSWRVENKKYSPLLKVNQVWTASGKCRTKVEMDEKPWSLGFVEEGGFFGKMDLELLWGWSGNGIYGSTWITRKIIIEGFK